MRVHSVSVLMAERLGKKRRAIQEAFDVEVARLAGMKRELASVDTEVLLAALDCFDSPRKAALWLTSPEKSLSGRTPLEMAMSTVGKEEVMTYLSRLISPI
jgi:uncharacterized protein (DUF2384 family)